MKKLYEQGTPDSTAAVNASRSVGKRVAELALLLKIGALAQTSYLEHDSAYETFLKRIKND